ncbi:MAG: hypothetical protein JST27_09810 [Bacteroidetes bacterium]|nr:hypothetical protein [Bacteroidota bacterium]
MKQIIIPIVLALFTLQAQAQEGTAELSKPSRKGFIANVQHNGDQYQITYKMAGDKKKDVISYETYNFDKDLKFIKSEQSQEPKASKEDEPDRTQDIMYAQVGGCSSFDVLSMKLKFIKKSVHQKWDYKNQYYKTDKVLSNETIKPKNDAGSLIGLAAFNNPTDGSLFVIALGDDEEDKKATQFLILTAATDADIVQKKMDIEGSQSLVFADQLKNGDVVALFAPNDGSPDLSAYTYLRYAPDGTLKNKCAFKSPSPNMIVTVDCEQDNSVFFCGTSTKKDDAYNRVFGNFAGAISNPCYQSGENKMDEKWTKRSEQRMANFHLLKFTGNNLDFASNEPIAAFKDKLKAAEGEKHPDAYEGKKFSIESFTVTPQGEYLIAGQLTGKVKTGSSKVVITAKSYEDIVCMQFDKEGHLKAQYATNKMNNDKKSEIFPVIQRFVPSKDGKSLYWDILEVKGFKGYENFFDAYNDLPTFYPKYFPRIAKLDLTATTIGSFKVLGDEDYYVSKDYDPIFNQADNSLVYIGSDENNKNLWLAKYVFE